MFVKKIYEKMVDYRQFATVLLAVGTFLYLGTIIPTTNIAISYIPFILLLSVAFLGGSIFFFYRAKQCKQKLLESDEGEDYFS